MEEVPPKTDGPLEKTEEGDLAGRFCDVTNLSREEALFYLEGFNWSLDDAVLGFYEGSLPPLRTTVLPPVQAEGNAAMPMASFNNMLLPVLNSADMQASLFEVPLASPTTPTKPRSTNLEASLKIGSQSGAEDVDWAYLTALANSLAENFKKPERPNDASDPIDKAGAEHVSAAYPTDASRVEYSQGGEISDQLSSRDTSTAPAIREATLELQLADGTETVVTFDSRDRIRDIRDYIDASRPDEPKDYQLLTKGSPQRELTNMDQTIEQAGVIGSGLIQKYHTGSIQVAGTIPSVGESTPMPIDSPDSAVIQGPRLEATTVQIQLADGSSIDLSFSCNHTIRDIHDGIDESRPDGLKDYHLLTTWSQPKQLTDLDQTIKEAGIAGSVLIQRYD